jgi:hypothetical protein
MPKGVHRYLLVYPRRLGCGMDSPVELTRAERVDGVQAWKQLASLEHFALGMGKLPPGAQAFQQDRRQHGVAFLTVFALFNAQRHALAIDVADLQQHHLADT